MNKKIIRIPLILLLIIILHSVNFAQRRPDNFVIITPGTTDEQITSIASRIIPTVPQLEWQKLEFTGFAHFGINTFTDKEWGDGTEDPSVFNPTDFNAQEWVQVFKDAGMKMLIIVAKHHDGFCYWPSKFTEHSVKKSPWKKGKGDLVGDLVKACHQIGLKVGIYLSPWDRHEKSYGNSALYNKFFINQLKELLTNYGEITEVWFDGAGGDAAEGKKQDYDWSAYYKTIRQYQPNALIFGMGPDIRWVGNEAGNARETEWSVVPVKVKNTFQASGSHAIDNLFIPGDLTQEDLGSREQISFAHALLWYPAEADVSIRPGWFYHQSEDNQVKTPVQLVDLYFNTIGRNAVFLLNVPPDKRGLIPESDIRSLMGMRSLLNQTFETNFADLAYFSYIDPESDMPYFNSTNKNINWQAKVGADSSILLLSMPWLKTFDLVMLQESVSQGQQIEKFRLEVKIGKEWKIIARSTTIGYKRFLKFPAVTSNQVRLVIEKSRGIATLCTFGLYKLPEELSVKK